MPLQEILNEKIARSYFVKETGFCFPQPLFGTCKHGRFFKHVCCSVVQDRGKFVCTEEVGLKVCPDGV